MKILLALIKKETLQIFRDPSAIMIAFVLPLLLLFIFGYGINLDSNSVNMGLVSEEKSPEVSSLEHSFTYSRSLNVTAAQDKRELEDFLMTGKLKGIAVIPQGFTALVLSETSSPTIQIITDGSDPNVASFVNGYVRGIIQVWLNQQARDQGASIAPSVITLEPRFWYNPELKSRNFLIPGSISIIMTLIGTLLTALVIAREWERGTMEALLATPVTIKQILLGKLIPYFFLGLCSMLICFIIATLWYEIPFRGSFSILLLCTSVFLISALGQGLLISSLARDQFLASQVALISAFLPAFMLSGFIFEISAMPVPIQGLTYIFAAKYFVTTLQSLFLAGNIWPLINYSLFMMLVVGLIFFILTARKTVKRLDA